MKSLLCVSLMGLLGLSAMAQISFTTDIDLIGQEIFSDHPIGVVDVNNDGLDDMVLLEDASDLLVLFQNEDGTFTTFDYGNVGGGAWGLCLGDLDKNGMLDMLAGGSYDDIKIVLLDDMTSGSQYNVEDENIFVQGVNFADINYDGNLDFFACHDDGPSAIQFGDGMGNFSAEGVDDVLDTDLYDSYEDNSGNYGSLWTDVNNDGYVDLYIAKCRQGTTSVTDVRRINQLWIYNPETGSYYEDADARGLANGGQSWIADFGDIDNDGDLDCFIANHDIVSELLLNDGNGYFTTVEESGIDIDIAIIQGAFHDFDNDAYMDLLLTGGGESHVYHNNGDNTFSLDTEVFGEYPINSFGLGDLNADGFTDVLATTGGYGGAWGEDGEADMPFINVPNDNNWLNVNLVGTESDINGIGARITITGSFGTQVRDVKSGESYGIQCSLIAHFGLGADETVTSVMVDWPMGSSDEITNVDGNQTITIEEGSSPVNVFEFVEEVEVDIYPNPTSEFVIVNSNSYEGSKDLSIVLFDMNGKIMLNQQVNNFQNQTIDLQDFSNGTYNLVLRSENDEIYNQLILKR